MFFTTPASGHHLDRHHQVGPESLEIDFHAQLEDNESQAQVTHEVKALDNLLELTDSDSDMFSDGWLDNESQAQIIHEMDTLEKLFRPTDSGSKTFSDGLLSSSGGSNCKSDDGMLPFFPRCRNSSSESESGNCQMFGELASNMTLLKEISDVPYSGGYEDQINRPIDVTGAMDHSSQSFNVEPSISGTASRAPLHRGYLGSRIIRTRRAISVVPGSVHASLDTELLQIFTDDDFRVPPPEWANKLKLAGLSVKLTKRAKELRRKILSRKYAGDNRKKTSLQFRALAESHSVLQRENAELCKQNSQLRDEVARLRREAIAVQR